MPPAYRSQIPQRLVAVADRCLPPDADTDAFWRRVDAEIVPDFREGISFSAYDDWLALQLTHLWATVSGTLTPADSLGDCHKIDGLLTTLRNSIPVNLPLPAETEFIRQHLEDRRREWLTDRLAPRLGRPNRKFIDDVMRRAREIPNEALESDEFQAPEPPTVKPPAFDRLPAKLFAYIVRTFPQESRGAKVWNRVRDFIYPHFDEELMPHIPYRAFLRLLTRFRAFGVAPASLLSEARGLRSFLEQLRDDPSDPARGNLTADHIDRIHDKVDGLVDTLQLPERKSESRDPPTAGPPLPDSGGPRR